MASARFNPFGKDVRRDPQARHRALRDREPCHRRVRGAASRIAFAFAVTRGIDRLPGDVEAGGDVELILPMRGAL